VDAGRIRAQPVNAEILIDGERWRGAEGGDRLLGQVAEGLHRVEVRKRGARRFSTDARVHGGETTPLYVSVSLEEAEVE
jgi:hypothetical protein